MDNNINNKNDRLVVVTKYFGYNFTGATLATHELVKEWKNYYDEIVIITKNLGKFDIEGLNIIECKNTFEVIANIINIKKENKNIIAYSDDHTGFLIKLAGLEYYHTYHANWPECRWVDWIHFLKSFMFIPMYKLTLSNAKAIIAVSYYSKHFIKRYNKNINVIRNGIGRNGKVTIDTKCNNELDDLLKVIMIGNIDKRKYKLAEQLFSEIEHKKINIKIDIYGNCNDEKLAKRLDKYKFVELKGFSNDINIRNYSLYISTSKNENLSIALCEALMNRVPVITFDVGGLSEVIVNGINGFIVEPYNVKSMLEIINEIKNKKFEMNFDRNNLESYDWKYSAKRYKEYFDLRSVL